MGDHAKDHLVGDVLVETISDQIRMYEIPISLIFVF